MTLGLSRILAVATSAVVLVASAFFLFQSFTLFRSTDPHTAAVKREPAVKTAAASESHEEGEGHAAAPAKPVDPNEPVLFDLDEVTSDLITDQDSRVHTLSLRLQLELFDADNKALVEKAGAGLKDSVLTLVAEKSMRDLGTLSGKLYFKEQLVSHLNTFLNQPVVRDIHFSSFLIK